MKKACRTARLLSSASIIIHRVRGRAVHVNLKMQMVAGRNAGRADLANLLPCGNTLARRYHAAGHMCIAGHQTAAVADDDIVAIGRRIVTLGNRTRSRSEHRAAARCADIQSLRVP